jgi:hypothetical protein
MCTVAVSLHLLASVTKWMQLRVILCRPWCLIFPHASVDVAWMASVYLVWASGFPSILVTTLGMEWPCSQRISNVVLLCKRRWSRLLFVGWAAQVCWMSRLVTPFMSLRSRRCLTFT